MAGKNLHTQPFSTLNQNDFLRIAAVLNTMRHKTFDGYLTADCFFTTDGMNAVSKYEDELHKKFVQMFQNDENFDLIKFEQAVSSTQTFWSNHGSANTLTI